MTIRVAKWAESDAIQGWVGKKEIAIDVYVLASLNQVRMHQILRWVKRALKPVVVRFRWKVRRRGSAESGSWGC